MGRFFKGKCPVFIYLKKIGGISVYKKKKLVIL